MKRIKLYFFKLYLCFLIVLFALRQILKRWVKKSHAITIGLLNIEFFHKEIGIYGGYGMNSKNIIDHFHRKNENISVELLLTRQMPKQTPLVKKLDDDTLLLVHSDLETPGFSSIFRYARTINSRQYNLLLTTEYNAAYFYSIALLPLTSLVIWIHDPRPKDEWEKIFTVSSAKLTDGKNLKSGFMNYENKSLRRILKLSRFLKRKVIFATTARSLIEKAKRAYNLPDIQPILLPMPIPMLEITDIAYPSRPTVCFLGRLDPVKRPWIFFELAKRFKDVDFIVAGKTHFPEIMDPIIKKYLDVSNLKFLGLTLGKDKDTLLKNTWCLINTSVHEALPVSFIEALAYGKPIISCHNPDELVSKFGVYTGEVLGEGTDEEALNKFSNVLMDLLTNRNKWIEKGRLGFRHVKSVYSFENFERVINELISH